MSNVERFGVHDVIEAYQYRNGKLIAARKTGPKSGLKATWIKFMKAIGLGAYWADDLITQVGIVTVSTYLKDTYVYMGIGTDQGIILPLANTNTALGNQSDRQSSANTLTDTNFTNDTSRMETTFSFGGDVAVCESGMFTSSSGGTMLCRQTFDALNMKSGDTLTLVWKIVVS